MKITIKIKNLALRTVIGLNEWEREKKQDLLINVEMVFETEKIEDTEDENRTLDYKAITKKIIAGVEGSSFYLLEALADFVLKVVMENPRVIEAVVEVDKPHSLRFAESVSVVVADRRKP
jgi:FolB domain-containing protein